MSLLPENETIEVDASAWPSSYYGKCQRVDLEKFFQKVQQEQLEQQQLDEDRERQRQRERGRRRVTFDPEPPTVCVYEPEYDTINTLDQQLQSSKDIWPSYARRPPHRLDLRPIRNELYGQPVSPSQPQLQYSPTTPPLSPCSPSLPEVDIDSSDDDEDQPTPTPTTTINTWTTTSSTPPFSPATLTKKLMTAVFTRRKRSQ